VHGNGINPQQVLSEEKNDSDWLLGNRWTRSGQSAGSEVGVGADTELDGNV
jgi:hypothetical protein